MSKDQKKKIFVSYKYGDMDVYPIKEEKISLLEIQNFINDLHLSSDFDDNLLSYVIQKFPAQRTDLSFITDQLKQLVESVADKEHKDKLQKLITFIEPTKARDYVTNLQDLLKDEYGHINKGEKDDESLEEFKDSTIQGKLADKIFDSTVTIVLISPNMKETCTREANQWIPWEISYSLKNKKRTDKSGNVQNSYMNATLAIVLPDKYGHYDYFIEDNINRCLYCNCRTLNMSRLFNILSENMHNMKSPEYGVCSYCNTRYLIGESSYILSVKWCDFIKIPNHYINRSLNIKEHHEAYNIIKRLAENW